MAQRPASHRTTARTADLGALLATEVDDLDREGCEARLGEIQRVQSQLTRLETRVSARIKDLHEAGKASPAADTHARTQRISAAEARRRARRAAAVRDAPMLGDALEDGSITSDHVDSYASATGKASDSARQTLARKQRHLTEQAKKLSPERFRRYCEQQVQHAEHDHGLDRDQQQRQATKLRSWINAYTGLRHIAGEFHPELGSRIWTAIQAEVSQAVMADDTNRLTDRDRLAAEALGRLVAGGHAATRPNRADVSVLISLDALRQGLHDNGVCELSDSSILPVETIRRMACDGNIIPIVLGGKGQVLDLGRSRRLASPAQRKGLRAVHDTCAFPGCDVVFDHCEIHHILDWDHLGPTDLDNLVPMCSRHHHLVHEGGWALLLDGDRTLHAWGPGQSAPPDAVRQHRAKVHDHSPPGDATAASDNQRGQREPAPPGAADPPSWSDQPTGEAQLFDVAS